jgi:hypothetical protein
MPVIVCVAATLLILYLIPTVCRGLSRFSVIFARAKLRREVRRRYADE